MAAITNFIRTAVDAHQVRTAEEYIAAAQRYGRRSRVFRDVQERPGPIDALVNGGRWVVICECGNAPAAHPNWRLAVCFECGSLWRPRFPTEVTRARIEWLLLARPIPNRNWHPGETAARLATENRAAGLPGDPGEVPPPRVPERP